MRGNKTEGLFVDVAHNWFLTAYVHQLKGKEIIMALALSNSVKDIQLNKLVLQIDKGTEIQIEEYLFLNFLTWKVRKSSQFYQKMAKVHYLYE